MSAITWAGANGDPWSASWAANPRGAALRTIQGNKGRLSTGATALAPSDAQYIAATFGDFEASFDAIAVTTAGKLVFAFRMPVDDPLPGLDYCAYPTTGYYLAINANGDTGTLQLKRRDNGNDIGLQAPWASGSLTVGDVLHWRVQATGSTIRARVWKNADAEPTAWTIDFVDATYATGRVMFGIENANAGTESFDFANLAISAPIVPPEPTPTWSDTFASLAKWRQNEQWQANRSIGVLDWGADTWFSNPAQTTSPFTLDANGVTLKAIRTPAADAPIIAQSASDQGFPRGAFTWLGGKLVSLSTMHAGQRLAARARFNQQQGTFPAIWLFADQNNLVVGKEAAEIDLMETFGTPNWAFGNIHRKASGGVGPSLETYAFGIDLSQWHDFVLDWRTDSLTFIVDGVTKATITGVDATWFADVTMVVELDQSMDAAWFAAGAMSTGATTSASMTVSSLAVTDLGADLAIAAKAATAGSAKATLSVKAAGPTHLTGRAATASSARGGLSVNGVPPIQTRPSEYYLATGHWAAGIWSIDAVLTPAARITSVVLELCGDESLAFSIPTDNVNAAQVQLLGREIICTRNGATIFWGFVVRATVGWASTDFQCVGMFYALRRRHYGTKPRVNLLANPSFESGGAGDLSGWSFENTTPATVSTHTFPARSDNPGVTHFGLNLAQSAGTTDNAAPALAWQQIQLASTVGAKGITNYHVEAWCHIRADTFQSTLNPQEFQGAYGEVGIQVVRSNAAKASIGHRMTPVDIADDGDAWAWMVPLAPGRQSQGGQGDYQMGRSYLMTLDVPVPPGKATPTIELRLGSPKGDIVWDAIECYAEDAVAWANMKVGDIMGAMIDYAQDPAQGKTTLNLDYFGYGTGSEANFSTRFADHRAIADGIQDFVNAGYGEWAFTFDWGGSRAFTYYANGRGSDKSATVILAIGSNISAISYQQDGSDSANSVVVTADQGGGAVRDAGWAVDATTFNGGGGPSTWETIIAAGLADAPELLGSVAAVALAKTKNLARALEITTLPDQALIDGVDVGDKVTIQNIARGYLNLGGVWRVVRKTLDPTTDTCRLTLNPPP
jgi:hypothetical protein